MPITNWTNEATETTDSSSSTLTFGNLVTSGNATIGGDLTITGGNITNALVCDSTLLVSSTLVVNSTLTVVGAVTTLSDVTVGGDLTVNGGDVTVNNMTNSGTFKIIATEGSRAAIEIQADIGTDNPDKWQIAVVDSGDSNKLYHYWKGSGSWVPQMVYNPNTTGANGLLTLAGYLEIGGNKINSSTGTVFQLSGNNATVVGDLIITGATKGIIHTNRGAVTQGTNATTAVTLNTTSGIITTYAATLATNTEVQFTLTNSTIQADSLVLVSMNDMNTDANSHILVTTNTIAGGSCIINLFNCGSGTATATACHIHFLVINNS